MCPNTLVIDISHENSNVSHDILFVLCVMRGKSVVGAMDVMNLKYVVDVWYVVSALYACHERLVWLVWFVLVCVVCMVKCVWFLWPERINI